MIIGAGDSTRNLRVCVEFAGVLTVEACTI